MIQRLILNNQTNDNGKGKKNGTLLFDVLLPFGGNHSKRVVCPTLLEQTAPDVSGLNCAISRLHISPLFIDMAQDSEQGS